MAVCQPAGGSVASAIDWFIWDKYPAEQGTFTPYHLADGRRNDTFLH